VQLLATPDRRGDPAELEPSATLVAGYAEEATGSFTGRESLRRAGHSVLHGRSMEAVATEPSALSIAASSAKRCIAVSVYRPTTFAIAEAQVEASTQL
jgi:hypothetical protein